MRVKKLSFDYSSLFVQVTKPRSKLARKLQKLGMNLEPLEEEGNIDRYVISKRLVIERRTGSSLLQGIMDKTLFVSAVDMREDYAIPILILEGEVNYKYTQFSPQAVRGALTSMMIEYGINVLHTANLEETEAIVTMIARQEQIGVPEISFVPKRKAVGIDDMQRRIIEMFPGIGRVKAREILQLFGSVKRFITATPQEILAVKGLGPKSVDQILKVINTNYSGIDFEKDFEDAIEFDSKLLFSQPVQLLARQHYIFSEEEQRHFIDMVFLDEAAKEVIIVELKRRILSTNHEKQLIRYLENAEQSKLLKNYLDKGYTLKGLLVTFEECVFVPTSNDVETIVVDKEEIRIVLKKLRKIRMQKLLG